MTASAASAGGRPRRPQRVVTLSSVCLLDGKQYQTKEYVLHALQQAPKKTDLVALPHLPFLSVTERGASRSLKDFATFAAARKTYLALSLMERAEGKVYATAFLFDRGGKIVGKYRKTHRMADDPADLALGAELPVFATDFGKVGLTITTDFAFFEPYSVLAMEGADVLVWHDYPDRVRDYSGHEPVLMARCLDSHCHMVAATYADPRTYITNSWEMGMPGAAWGRSMVLNRVGTPVADTGYEDGVATATVDLDKRKVEVYQPSYEQENIFFVNNYGDRKAFGPVAQPYVKPKLPAYAKRTARVAVAWLPRRDSWVAGKMPDRMLALIAKAKALKPDLVLLSEMSTKVEDETTRQAMGKVGALAKQLGAYVAIGGIGEGEQVSYMRVWDRQGTEIYAQALYWPRGYPEIKVFDTDFGRVGSHECGDLYLPEFDRTLTLLGAELIIDGSQMWGASGRTNETMLRARAIDNGVWVACAHWPTSDPSLRSLIIDPYGQIMASSAFEEEGIITYDINLDRQRVYYAGQKAQQATPGTAGIPSYFSDNLPDRQWGWRDMMLANRRPELYGILPTCNEVTAKYRGKERP
ncbi:MAG: carbon-nitrogen hydrolase family protein [Armatimonadetes bacterium]|nr:carbon-nitrogen hydrolase family protein [Armatimonadota bacterium]